MHSNILKRTKFRWLIVFLLFLIIIFNFLDRSATAFILEDLATEFNLTHTQLGLIMGSFSIGFLITAFLGGIGLDKYGPKLIITIIIIGWAASMVFMASATCFFSFFLARIFLGIAEGPIIPAVTMSTQKWLPTKERLTALSFIFIASTLGVVLSGPVVTTLTYWFSWKGMFIILGLFSLAWLPIWLIFFKNRPQDSKYVNKLELHHINEENEINEFKEETHNKVSLSTQIKNILGNSTLLVNIFAYCVFCFFFYFFVSWLPTYFSKTHGVSLLFQGGTIIIIWGSATLCMLFSGPLLDYIYKVTNNLRYVRSYPIILANLIPSLCIFLLLAFKPNLSISIVLITISLGFIMVASPLYYLVNLEVVKQNAGFALGVMEASTSVAGFLAPVVTGYIVDITKSFNSVYFFLIFMSLFCIFTVLIWHKPHKNIIYYKKVD